MVRVGVAPTNGKGAEQKGIPLNRISRMLQPDSLNGNSGRMQILGKMDEPSQLSIGQTLLQLIHAKSRLLSILEAEEAIGTKKVNSDIPVLTGTIVVCSGNDIFGQEIVSGDMTIRIPSQYAWARGTLVLHPEAAIVREIDGKVTVTVSPSAVHTRTGVQFLGSANFGPESIGKYAGFCVLTGEQLHAMNGLNDVFGAIPVIPMTRSH